MEVIKKKQIETAFKYEYRQYLAGKLSRPQEYLDCIDDDIEIGISDYTQFTADQPHVHPIATEHCIVLAGEMKIRCFENGKTIEETFCEGDFVLIRPGITHASKNKAGTRILFIKSPGINDKTIVEVDDNTKRWLTAW